MITPVNQVQPQFKAQFNLSDISILANEAKRSKAPQSAMQDLNTMLELLKVLPEKKAALTYKTENPISKFNLILDGKKSGFSAVSFTEALKKLCSKRIDLYSANRIKTMNHSEVTRETLDKFALDA